MEVIPLGDLMANVQNLVEVECKLERELAPTRLQRMAVRTAAIWEKASRPENVTRRVAQV